MRIIGLDYLSSGYHVPLLLLALMLVALWKHAVMVSYTR